MEQVDKLFPPPADSRHRLKDIPKDRPKNVRKLFRELLAEADRAIVLADPFQLLQDLAAGKVTAVEAAGAFLRAGVIAQHLLNCVTEFLPQEALETAQKLDKHLKETGKPVGPFHGLPISLKEMVGLKDKACHFQTSAFIDAIMPDDSVVVKILYKAGANPFCRTTGPQLLMTLESDSPLQGKTLNPYNTDLSSSGSSSGEGAIIGLGASLFGVGTDIGGSIRSPSAACGIYGLRTSVSRIPIVGMNAPMHGHDSVKGVAGPMSSHPAMLELFMKVVSDAQPWRYDFFASRASWRPELFKGSGEGGKLRVGWYVDDGDFTPHPPVIRAIKEFVEKLEATNTVELVPYEPYRTAELCEAVYKLYFPDGGKWVLDTFAKTGEPMTDQIRAVTLENPHLADMNLHELWAAQATRDRLQYEYAQHWRETGIDLLITPVFPGAAPAFNTTRYWGYTALWNLLDYPSMSIPFSHVKPTDLPDANFVPKNELDAGWQALYKPEIYQDAPLAIQVIGPRMHDELVLHALEQFANIKAD